MNNEVIHFTQADAALWDTAWPEADRFAVQRKLWELLALQTQRYTMGESTSVRTETAQELLESIMLTLRLALQKQHATPQLLLTADLSALLAEGQACLKEEVRRGQRLWQAVCQSAPNLENTSYRDTLKSIGTCFSQYDFRFFACTIPCDIDYQLACPISEQLQGILYLNEYLRHMLAENCILHCFDRRTTICLLRRYCPDYIGLLINLCEPVIINALGLALLGKNPLTLKITQADRAALAALFDPLPKAEALAALSHAAKQLCRAADITDAFTAGIVAQTAQALAPRLFAALAAGTLSGVFITPAD